MIRVGDNRQIIVDKGFLLIICIFSALTIELNPIVNRSSYSKDIFPVNSLETIKNISPQNLKTILVQLQSYGNRSTWEKQCEAANWIYNEFKEIGLEVHLQYYEYNGKKWPNVIVKIGGKSRPDEVIMLIAHIDSTSDNSQNIAPGADDNGSGVAVLYEIARILKGSVFERSIYFGVFTNEEHCRQGSRSFAHWARLTGMNIKAVINLDILGYNKPDWPFYLKGITGHQTLKHKIKAII